jgi:hypothetical protein
MPPASETASFIQMLSFLIPIGALTLIFLTAPSIRKSISEVKDNYQNYFHGDSLDSEQEKENKEVQTQDSSKETSVNLEIHAIDHSIYETDQ